MVISPRVWKYVSEKLESVGDCLDEHFGFLCVDLNLHLCPVGCDGVIQINLIKPKIKMPISRVSNHHPISVRERIAIRLESVASMLRRHDNGDCDGPAIDRVADALKALEALEAEPEKDSRQRVLNVAPSLGFGKD